MPPSRTDRTRGGGTNAVAVSAFAVHNKGFLKKKLKNVQAKDVVIFYHETIVVIEHELSKKIWLSY